MKIKEFVEQYNGYATDYLKEDFLKENLKITPYIPFVTKEAIARQEHQQTERGYHHPGHAGSGWNNRGDPEL